jgi:hypothetical protein
MSERYEGVVEHVHEDRCAELEMTPPPLKADIAIHVRFPTGDERVFVLCVPDEVKPAKVEPSDIRPSTRSRPCDPLSQTAFDIGVAVMHTENGIPLLVTRSAALTQPWRFLPLYQEWTQRCADEGRIVASVFAWLLRKGVPHGYASDQAIEALNVALLRVFCKYDPDYFADYCPVKA